MKILAAHVRQGQDRHKKTMTQEEMVQSGMRSQFLRDKVDFGILI
jgi:hypothetical protein